MKEYVYFISDNKMFRLSTSSGRSEEINSQLLESYKDKIRENARRNEWKNNGSGAIFMGEVDPSDSPEVAARKVNSYISAMREDGDKLLYSMSIDNISGIYTHSDHTDKDGIVFSRNEYDYTHFDINGKRIVLSEECGAESHIGILENGTSKCEILTEGESRECWPTWSRMKNDRIIYSGCGLALTHDKGVHHNQSMPMHMRTATLECVEGPYSVCAFDLKTMELSELIEDRSQKYSYIKPFESSEGYIYYIKKPYREKHEEKSGCLDALLAPFRLIAALFGFLNFFSMKYSGKTLTKNNGSSKAKQRSEAQMFIDGNLINAAEEMERNQKSGDKFPGVIPRSYELCRRLGPGGDEEVIKKGIIAYTVDKNGDVICSNGTHLLKLTPSGEKYEETLLTKERSISFVSI